MAGRCRLLLLASSVGTDSGDLFWVLHVAGMLRSRLSAQHGRGYGCLCPCQVDQQGMLVSGKMLILCSLHGTGEDAGCQQGAGQDVEAGLLHARPRRQARTLLPCPAFMFTGCSSNSYACCGSTCTFAGHDKSINPCACVTHRTALDVLPLVPCVICQSMVVPSMRMRLCQTAPGWAAAGL